MCVCVCVNNTYRMFLKHFCNCCNNFVFCITDVSNIYTGVFHSFLLQVSGFTKDAFEMQCFVFNI